MLPRPPDLFDRTTQWDALSSVTAPTGAETGMRLAIVSGRRRHGKSYLLRRLVQARSDVHHQAREVEEAFALDLFARDVADHLEHDPDALRFDSWETAFRVALGLRRGTRRARGAGLLVLDELPHLLSHSPEIPSVLQLLHDEVANDPRPGAPTVVLCPRPRRAQVRKSMVARPPWSSR